MLYTDDSILAGPNKDEIKQIIKSIQDTGLNITVEGDLQDFLGINIKREDNGSIYLLQLHLIDQILNASKIDRCQCKSQGHSSKIDTKF